VAVLVLKSCCDHWKRDLWICEAGRGSRKEEAWAERGGIRRRLGPCLPAPEGTYSRAAALGFEGHGPGFPPLLE
jgi:hypothetical protein